MGLFNKITVSVAGLLVLYTFDVIRRRRSRPAYPPGPPGDFIIGNLRQIPRKLACVVYEDWGRLYGPLTHFSVLGRHFVVLNKYQAAQDLLEKRGSLYSDRPRFIMAGELVDLQVQTALCRFGNVWKRHRRFLNQHLNAGTVWRNYAPLQERKAYRYIKSCLDNPGDYLANVNRITGEAVTEIAYGDYHNDEYDFVDLNEELSTVSPKLMTGYLVDWLPWLKHVPSWLPGASFKREARYWKARYLWIRRYLLNNVKKQLASGANVRTSYASSLLQDLIRDGELSDDDETLISGSAFTFYRAGNDTTVSSLTTFIFAMCLYPEIQVRAQQELDRVCGNRIPNLNDRDSLPYITAIVLEAMRWAPPLTCGVSHALMQDDTYDGYFIPKGTTVIANLWAISRDENLFENPDTFDPSRYYEQTGALDPRDFVFGFGRRICPGIHLAFQGIFISVATMLWSFKMVNKSPELHRGLPSRELFDLGFSSKPKPFSCDFIPRFDYVRTCVEEASAA